MPVLSPRNDKHRETARRAGLRYVTDGVAGIRRKKAGKGWIFLTPGGGRIKDSGQCRRIASLAIPPA